MQKSVRDESGRVFLKFEGCSSICRFTGQTDVGDIELDYVPGRGQVRIDSEKLQGYLSSLKTRRIAMEMIPIEILKFCIEECLEKPPPMGRRYAAPDEIAVRYSLSLGKDWGMTTRVTFNRET